MMFTTVEDVIAYVGVKTPTEEQSAWAQKCVDAVNDGILIRLNGATVTDPPPAELGTVATMAAGEAYKRREVPFGITSFNDTEGAIRLARDYLEQVKPQIDRYGNGPGIG